MKELYTGIIEWPPSDNYTKLGLVVLWIPKTLLGFWSCVMMTVLFVMMLVLVGPIVFLEGAVEKLDAKYGLTPKVNRIACSTARKLALIRRC